MKINLKICIYASVLGHFERGELTVEKLAPYLNFTPRPNPSEVVIGEVEVDVEVLPEDEIVGNTVIVLRAQAASIRAEAADKARAIEGRVQQLLSIENKLTKED